MAVRTPCQTSGAQFHIGIGPRAVSASVDLPFDLNLTEMQAATLDANVHNALEMALAPLFVGKSA